jgi:hypothetical protein
MLTVIFGAGASYDSLWQRPAPQGAGEDHPSRPPLSEQLFAARFQTVLNAFPSVRYVMGEFERRGDRSVEEVLEEFQDEALSGKDPQRWRHLSAVRYYLRRAIQNCDSSWAATTNGRTNYLELVGRLRRWWHESNEQCCFVTFNYDRLLDWACQDELGLNLNSLDDYVSRESFKIIKFHGSINWVRPLDPDSRTKIFRQDSPSVGDLISRASEIRVTDEFLPVGEGIIGESETDRPNWLPALAIPIQKKAKHECPDAQIVALKGAMASTTRLLIIGWRGAEQHFWKLWEQRPPPSVKVLVSSGSGTIPPPLAANLPGRLGIDESRIGVTGGFTRLLAEQPLRDFLDMKKV